MGISGFLRYYATFKVRKIELFFLKINTFLQKTNTCIELQAEQISSGKCSDPGHFLKSQGNFFLSFLCPLFLQF